MYTNTPIRYADPQRQIAQLPFPPTPTFAQLLVAKALETATTEFVKAAVQKVIRDLAMRPRCSR
jgi:hypothetical protein